jgi:hypothetical protein
LGGWCVGEWLTTTTPGEVPLGVGWTATWHI